VKEYIESHRENVLFSFLILWVDKIRGIRDL